MFYSFLMKAAHLTMPMLLLYPLAFVVLREVRKQSLSNGEHAVAFLASWTIAVWPYHWFGMDAVEKISPAAILAVPFGASFLVILIVMGYSRLAEDIGAWPTTTAEVEGAVSPGTVARPANAKGGQNFKMYAILLVVVLLVIGLVVFQGQKNKTQALAPAEEQPPDEYQAPYVQEAPQVQQEPDVYETEAGLFFSELRLTDQQFENLKVRAHDGDAAAQARMGDHYFYGVNVPQDQLEGIRWYESAANRGNAKAQSRLGAVYQSGGPVERDYEAAARLYTLAAAQGDLFSQLMLGRMYEYGEGVAKDLVRAHMYFNLAAAHADDGLGTSETARKMRDAVGQNLSQSQLLQAQELAAEFRGKQAK